MRGGRMRVGEKSRPALSPKRMTLQEDASRAVPSSPFVTSGPKPSANRLGQRITKTLPPLAKTSLNLGIGPQKRNKRND
jgi:hypothetical protein